MNSLRIFLADDHVVMREGLRSLVNAQADMGVVGEADNGRAALLKASELQPDVIVMDVSMPELNGIQVTERLKRIAPRIKVLVLTAHDDSGYLRQLLEVGASGYVLKKAAAEELIKAIRVVAAGGVYLDPSFAGKVLGGYVGGRKRLRGASQGNNLSERESEVLRLVAWGYTNKEVAAYLSLSVKTIETHKGNFMGKLDLKSRAEVVRYALRQGWLREP
ncbi:MAG TPA: response regulator transcription factor [Pyrinomonadaceae bacterium]|nr:response regulator transcription factor [Pyrinomonadaceae bacterium]